MEDAILMNFCLEFSLALEEPPVFSKDASGNCTITGGRLKIEPFDRDFTFKARFEGMQGAKNFFMSGAS